MDPRHLEHGHAPRDIARRLRRGPHVSYLRDWVYGGIDGTVTTFAVVAGVAGAELSIQTLLILGAANLLADGFSMAAANYSGTKAEIEEYEQVRRMEERHVELAPEGEREEIRQIFHAKGFRGDALDSAVDVITDKRQRWIETMMTEEHGLPPVSRSPAKAARPSRLYPLRRDPVAALRRRRAGLTMDLDADDRRHLLLYRSLRGRLSPSPWWRAGIETFLIGITAALGVLLSGLVSSAG